MLSKKSFGGHKRNFLKLLKRFVRSDVRDHIVSEKNDHGPSDRHDRASQQPSSPIITICEILPSFDFRQHRPITDKKRADWDSVSTPGASRVLITDNRKQPCSHSPQL